MDYQIAISPDLNINTVEFVSSWNYDLKCRQVAQAEVSDTTAVGYTYLDPELIRQGLIFLGSVAGTIAVDVVKDLVKEQLTELLKEKFVDKPQIEVESIRQPGGAYLLVVKAEE